MAAEGTETNNNTEGMTEETNHISEDEGIELQPGANATQSEGDCIEIQKVEYAILQKFGKLYDDEFANSLLNSFKKIVFEEEFTTIAQIADDIQDSVESAIFDGIWNDLEQKPKIQKHDKAVIIKQLQEIIHDQRESFNIRDFTFTVTKSDVAAATKLAKARGPVLFKNQGPMICPDGKLAARANWAEEKSICIAKAVDLKNGHSILKWLLESFSRDRVIGHKILYQKFGALSADEYPFESDRFATGYNPSTWWLHDSAYCKWIQYRNIKMTLPMMTALQGLGRRALPQLSLNSISAPKIYDDLNDFAKYVFASWAVSHALVSDGDSMIDDQDEKAPRIYSQNTAMQIDIWVIPQLVKPPDFDLSEFLDDEDIEGQNDFVFQFRFLSNEFNKLGKARGTKKVRYGLWDLAQHLKESGYVENKDYWTLPAKGDIIALQTQLMAMLRIAANDNPQETAARYIFIIDRRNPQNIAEKKMRHNFNGKTNGFIPDTKNWTDKIYLIIPKQESSATVGMTANDENETENDDNNSIMISEQFWTKSKRFLFPADGNDEGSIGILDDLNGYKFVLSFHLYPRKSSVYWYSDYGSEKFELDDTEWLLTRYFAKIKDKQQTLTDDNLITLYRYKKQKPLIDEGFVEFWKQSHRMILLNDE